MLKNYETVFILNPVLSEDQMKETVQKFRKFLTDNGAEIVHEEDWGLKKLAYPIQKKSTGFYFLFEFEATNTTVADFEVLLKRDERILRFLTVKMNEDHIEYAESRRKKNSGKAAPAEA